MAEPADSALITAQRLVNDNRSAVGGKTDKGYRVAVLPTLPDGKAFVAQKADSSDATGTEVVGAPTAAAHVASVDVEKVVVPIDIATALPTGGSKYVRRQVFRYIDSKGVLLEKWCYTNSTGWPLKADGTKATDVASAPNSLTTVMTAVGEAVPTFNQPGPPVGTHNVSERQQGYAPSLGWVANRTTT